jgi:VWFA-related protein
MPRSGFRVGVLSLVCALSLGVAQEEPRVSIIPRVPDRIRSGNLRLDVNVVLIPVTVTDALDRPVRKLQKQDFRVFDGDVEQKIVYFSGQEAPVSVGLVLDVSGSMKDKVDLSREGVVQFLKASVPEDEFMLVKFSDRAERACGFTADPDEIQKLLEFLRPKGWTALNDAIFLAAHAMKAARHAGKALLVLTDGGDNNSRYSDREIRELVREADVRVFAIGLFDRPRLLRDMAEQTGGRIYPVHKREELAGVASKIADEIHSEYLLGYVPANSENDGKYHKVQVKLVQKEGAEKLSATWRRGYYAPAE